MPVDSSIFSILLMASPARPFVVGARAEQGGHLAKVVLQGRVEFALVEAEFAVAVNAQADITGGFDVGARRAGVVGDHGAHLGAYRFQQAFAC
jgi:hypothetical protein